MTIDCGPVMVLPWRDCFKSDASATYYANCDVLLLSGQSLLSVDLPIPRGWPLNGDSIVL